MHFNPTNPSPLFSLAEAKISFFFFFCSFCLNKSRNWKRSFARWSSISQGSLLCLCLDKINNKNAPEMVSPWMRFRFTWRVVFRSRHSAATSFQLTVGFEEKQELFRLQKSPDWTSKLLKLIETFFFFLQNLLLWIISNCWIYFSVISSDLAVQSILLIKDKRP